ncbi:MAG: DUF1206 domain-containing protein [Cyanobacteria bacterium P01_A01_bin.114]
MPTTHQCIVFAAQQITQIQHWVHQLFTTVWMQRLIRFGHAAKGGLYGAIGLISMRSVIYDSESAGGSEAVMAALDDRAIGSVLLLLLCIGLAGYSFWRFVQVLVDPDHANQPMTLQRIAQRCGYACSGLTYLGIGYSAGRLAIGLTVDFDDTAEEIAETLFEVPIGAWALSACGVGVIGIGLIYIYGAYSGSFISNFQTKLYSAVKRSTVFMGKLGYTARGVSFVLVGAYLIKAAYFLDDEAAGGVGQVLDRLDDVRFGKIWLTAIAFGFFAYAIYMIMAALYRKFPTEKRLG